MYHWKINRKARPIIPIDGEEDALIGTDFLFGDV
jgi:hypothetical protein